MGSELGFADEKPPHQVTITRPFYISISQITQQNWLSVMHSNPSRFQQNKNHPVEQVSWLDVQMFINRLNEQSGTHSAYRLPTEAEWEYACRAGTSSNFFFGNDANMLVEYGWYKANSLETPHPVKQKKPNSWGLFDMHGNVWEWVQDFHSYYVSKDLIDPLSSTQGAFRIVRGGSFRDTSEIIRSFSRKKWESSFRNDDIGFRVVIQPEKT